MAKEQEFKWRIPVPEVLQKGEYFDRWDEELNSTEPSCFFRVDEDGIFLYWTSEGRDTQLIDLTQVSEVRIGGISKDSKIFADLEQRLGQRSGFEERCMTIVSGLDLVNLVCTHCLAKNACVAKEWSELLSSVLHNFRIYHISPMTCLWKHWKMLCLSLKDARKIPVRSITRTFASGKTEKMVIQCLVEFGLCVGKNDEIECADFTFEKFYQLYLKICPRPEVQELFDQISENKAVISVTQMLSFLNEKQRDPRLNEILYPEYDRIKVKQLVMKYEKDTSFAEKGLLTFAGFLNYLMSDDNAPVLLNRVELYQDMDLPLCQYLINSSHNTYLTGRQFGGRSSVEMYRQVLLTGCRCIELDCWDGGSGKDEPIITHGKAMCTDILFKDVIMAIRDTAFVASDYPVILSFENHCSKSNQLKMARYCLDIFGDLLLTKPLETHLLEPGVPLPSPNMLKRKILIKNKRLNPDIERQQLEQFLKEGRVDEDIDEDVETPDVGDLTLDDVIRKHVTINQSDGRRRKSGTPSHADSSCSEGDHAYSGVPDNEAHPELKITQTIPEAVTFREKLKSLASLKGKENVQPSLSKEEEERLLAMYHYTSATTNIHPLLSSLVNYMQPVKFQGFDVSEQNNMHFHMSSFSESTALGYLKQSAIEFVNYNKRQLSRIYPKGGRVDSSNFLPQIFWNAGVQMVALNFQTPDLAMQLNQGRFEYNGNCGYLLKPDFMRRPNRNFDPFSESPVDGVIAAYCSVRVISGQFLSDRKIGTFVEVEMYGLPTDTIRKEFRTKMVPANGLNPVYNEESFVFRKVVLPELAVLRIAVYDENNKLLGQRILPLDGLQSGYRHISLRTETNLPMTLPTIFCHVVLKTYIPEGLGGIVEALSDPRTYVSMIEKRQKQMEQMGIRQEDIDEVPQRRPFARNGGVVDSFGSISNKSVMGSQNFSVTARSKICLDFSKDDAYRQVIDLMKPVCYDEIKKDKVFVKLSKRHVKELDELKRRQVKERQAMQNQQAVAIEKIVRDRRSKGARPTLSSAMSPPLGSDRSLRQMSGDTSESFESCSSRALSDTPTTDDCADVKTAVALQTKNWSELMRRQADDEHRLRVVQIEEEWNLVTKTVEDIQRQQVVSFRQRLDNEFKFLRQKQAKQSMEDSKAIQMDKNIKAKAERDRRVKEVQEKNCKLFLEERKRLAVKHQKMLDHLHKVHEEQLSTIEKEARKVKDTQEQLHTELLLAAKPETVV